MAKVHRVLGVGQFIPGRVRAEEFFVMLRRKELHGHGVDLAALHAGLLQDHGKVFRAATHAAKAWPASCVSTSTSSDVPLKLEKMKGAL